MSKPTSLSIVIVLITIPLVKKSAIDKRGLTQWHWKEIWVFFGVIGIFPMAKLTIYYAKSIIYTMSSDIIREATIIIIKLNSIKVY